MANFFETEARKLQEQFNQVFGGVVVCDLKARQTAFLSIVSLAVLGRRLSKAKHKERSDIKKFIKRRNIINQYLNRRCEHVERTYN